MKNIKTYYEDKLKLFSDNFVVNWHEHVREASPGTLDEAHCDRLYYGCKTTFQDKVLVSVPILDEHVTIERCAQANDTVYKAMQRYPDMIMGMCFVNGGHKEKAVDEVKRCVDMGFVGVKLYHQYFINDEIMNCLVEACIDMDIPILVHAGKLMRFTERQPRLSGGEHFADMGRRYPEANIIMAHIAGGGDWQWQLKGIADVKNIYTDLSGSVVDYPVVEETVKTLGADRVLFGTDGTLFAGVGKVLAANIPDEDKKTILAGTSYERFIRKVNK